jgi:hypothetical protein
MALTFFLVLLLAWYCSLGSARQTPSIHAWIQNSEKEEGERGFSLQITQGGEWTCQSLNAQLTLESPTLPQVASSGRY